MAEISAAQVKELRDATNVSMMECKKALVEAGGDKDAAVRLLRERGLAIAGKKSTRTAKEGLVAAEVSDGGKLGVMLEVNCETDFVARNEVFQAFVKDLLVKARDVGDDELADAVKDEVVAKVAEIGENIIVRRNIKYEVQGTGLIASYIHLGGKMGVLIEVGCEKEETTQNATFKELVKDITLHIAACNPLCLKRDEVPEELIRSEREIFAKQVEGKPENIIEKIVTGKLEKYLGQICLVEQAFVKNPDQSVTQVLEEKGGELDDALSIRRYARYQIGA